MLRGADCMDIISNICEENNIKLLSEELEQLLLSEILPKSTQGYGYACKFEDSQFIAYDKSASVYQKNAIILHEIGHIILGHFKENNCLSKENKELEARIFSIVMIVFTIWDKWKDKK